MNNGAKEKKNKAKERVGALYVTVSDAYGNILTLLLQSTEVSACRRNTTIFVKKIIE